jgi:hypothetical protein
VTFDEAVGLLALSAKLMEARRAQLPTPGMAATNG